VPTGRQAVEESRAKPVENRGFSKISEADLTGAIIAMFLISI